MKTVASPAEAWIEIAEKIDQIKQKSVASPAEAWIEIDGGAGVGAERVVASPAEAWIEIQNDVEKWAGLLKSPPLRRRGLKSTSPAQKSHTAGRLPCGGVD